MVLARLVAGEPLALDHGAEAARRQHVGEPARAIGDLGPREPLVAEDDAFAIGNRGGDRFVGRRQVQVHRANLNGSPWRHESSSTVRRHGGNDSDFTRSLHS